MLISDYSFSNIIICILFLIWPVKLVHDTKKQKDRHAWWNSILHTYAAKAMLHSLPIKSTITKSKWVSLSKRDTFSEFRSVWQCASVKQNMSVGSPNTEWPSFHKIYIMKVNFFYYKPAFFNPLEMINWDTYLGTHFVDVQATILVYKASTIVHCIVNV